LCARALLDEQKFAAFEVAIAPAQYASELEWECDVTVEILM
jgi:hypothetical protein